MQRKFHIEEFVPSRAEIVMVGAERIGTIAVSKAHDHLAVDHLYLLMPTRNGESDR
ncbi:MAG: hypothetical protein ACYTFG_16925 [Planctomycetota bacterium]|jgi:hypothetical protein